MEGLDGKTIADLLRADLLNYELAIQSATARIAFYNALMKRLKGKRSPKSKRDFVRAKVNREIYETYLEDVLRAKDELEHGIDCCFGSYPRAYRSVFKLAFLENLPPDKICEQTGLSLKAVEFIVAKMERDLLVFYCP